MATTTLAPPTVHSGINSQDSASKFDLSCEFEVEYPCAEMAHIVQTSLSVDAELQPDKVFREMNVIGNTLAIKFKASEGRYLRASVSAFMDILVLATRTVEQFGQTFE